MLTSSFNSAISFGSTYNPHVNFEYLRRGTFDEGQQNGVLETVLLCLANYFRDLLNFAVLPPARPRGVKVARYVVGNIGDDKQCFREYETLTLT